MPQRTDMTRTLVRQSEGRGQRAEGTGKDGGHREGRRATGRGAHFLPPTFDLPSALCPLPFALQPAARRRTYNPHVDLRQLEILRAVADTGSFTAAGHQLHLSQSAVSRQILLLEEELEEELFLRLGRKIRITPAGTTLLGLSERMFEDLERTRASILDSQRS